MNYFDRVSEQDINGTLFVVAVNDKSNEAYIVKGGIIGWMGNPSTGFTLNISCHPETYIYRNKFDTEDELDAFVASINQLTKQVENKNNRYLGS